MVPLRNCCGWHIEPVFVLSCVTRSSCCHVYCVMKIFFPFCQNSCTLKYISGGRYGNYYPFELVVEDFPNRNITVSYSDGSYSTKGPLSVGRSKRQSPLTTTTVPTTTALFRRSIAPLSKLPLQFSVYGAIYLFFYFSSIDLNVNIYYQILSITQRPSLLPSDFQVTLLPLHALRVITFPFSWHQLQLMEQIFQRLSTRPSTSKSGPEHKTPRKEMLFLNHSVILQQISEYNVRVMCIDIRFSGYFCNMTYSL